MNAIMDLLLQQAHACGDFKTWLTLALGLSRDALHIHVGLVLVTLLALLPGQRPGALIPWLGVLFLTLLGEWDDAMLRRESGRAFDLAIHVHDIWNTMAWPTAITLWATWRHRQRMAVFGTGMRDRPQAGPVRRPPGRPGVDGPDG